MKRFFAKCFALPVVDNVEDGRGYKIGGLYLFNELDELPWNDSTYITTGDDGIKHKMDADYFSKYFTRVFTDKDGYYVER